MAEEEEKGLRNRKYRYLWGLIWGGGLVLLYALPHGGFHVKSWLEGYFIWGNACAIAGMLLFLAAGCMKLNRIGMWDWLLYGFYQARYLLSRDRTESYTSYQDFRELRERGTGPLFPILLIAGILELIGILLSVQVLHFMGN